MWKHWKILFTTKLLRHRGLEDWSFLFVRFFFFLKNFIVLQTVGLNEKNLRNSNVSSFRDQVDCHTITVQSIVIFSLFGCAPRCTYVHMWRYFWIMLKSVSAREINSWTVHSLGTTVMRTAVICLTSVRYSNDSSFSIWKRKTFRRAQDSSQENCETYRHQYSFRYETLQVHTHIWTQHVDYGGSHYEVTRSLQSTTMVSMLICLIESRRFTMEGKAVNLSVDGDIGGERHVRFAEILVRRYTLHHFDTFWRFRRSKYFNDLSI